jgi:hypothetical protein
MAGLTSILDRLLFEGVVTAHIATTQEERRAIQAFRYSIYVEELGKTVVNADHTHKRIADAADNADNAVLIYTGSVADITGSVRIEFFGPGEVPKAVRNRFSMDRFEDIDLHGVSVSSRMTVDRSLRGKLVLPAIARAAYRLCVERGVVFDFIYCAPGLVTAWRRLGYRPFGGDPVASADGLRIPLAGAIYDVDFFRSVRSPLASIARNAAREGCFDAAPASAWASHFDPDNAGLLTELDRVHHAVRDALFRNGNWGSRLFAGLSDDEVRLVVSRGFVIDVPDSRPLTRERLAEREIFLILDGTCRVQRGHCAVAGLQRGDVFGEMAQFLDSGRRTATVYSQGPARLLVLRRNALAEISAEDPRLATKLMRNLCTIMTRLAPAERAA